MSLLKRPTFRVVLHLKGAHGVTALLVYKKETESYSDAHGDVPDAVAAFLAGEDLCDLLNVHSEEHAVVDVTLSLPNKEFDFVSIDALHSKTCLEAGEDPLPAFSNTQLKKANWKHTSEENERFLAQLRAAAPGTSTKKLLKLREEARPESDCDEDENPVSNKQPKRDDYAFNSELHARLTELNHPDFEMRCWDFNQGGASISVYKVTAKAPSLTTFFLAVDKLMRRSSARTRSIWACAPLPNLEPKMQAERISIMYNATPFPIAFRPSYIEPEGRRLSCFGDVRHVLGRFRLPSDIQVRDVSGFFDHRPHTERLVNSVEEVTGLLLEWLSMDAAQRRMRVGEKAKRRLAATATELAKLKDEAKEWDGEYVEIKEASEGDEKTPEPSDDEGEDLDDDDDADEEEEYDEDEEEEEEEDSFIATDDDEDDDESEEDYE